MRRHHVYRVSAGKAKGQRNRKLGPSRRVFKPVRGRLIDLDYQPRSMARWVLSSFRYRDREVWTVSELNSGLRVAMDLSADDAIYKAKRMLHLHGPTSTKAAMQRGIHRTGRANAWRKAWRS